MDNDMTIMSCDRGKVSAGGTAVGAVLSDGDMQRIGCSGSAVGTLASFGGVQRVYGLASATLAGSGGHVQAGRRGEVRHVSVAFGGHLKVYSCGVSVSAGTDMSRLHLDARGAENAVTSKLSGTVMTLAKAADASQKITVSGWSSGTHSAVSASGMSAFGAWASTAAPRRGLDGCGSGHVGPALRLPKVPPLSLSVPPRPPTRAGRRRPQSQAAGDARRTAMVRPCCLRLTLQTMKEGASCPSPSG
ncbi:MAG: hypothetical protein K6E40_16555 [Desulfovibrio sp.]|nr:hypothetical protein [Desulfovibrio sp.]